MTIHFKQATFQDIENIITLGNEYSKNQLSPQEFQEGFLSIHFTPKIVENFLKFPSILAYDGDQLASFLLNLSGEENLNPICLATLSTLKKIAPNVCNSSWIFYGPIVVDKKYRGQNLPKLKLDQIKPLYKSQNYKFAICFIDKENKPSLNVHTEKLNFNYVGDFVFSDKNYSILILEI